MPKHRGLTLKKFVGAIPWDLFERYFDSLELEELEEGVSDWVFLNADAMQEFLDRSDNTEARGVILEDFRRINDICHRSMNLLVRAHYNFNIRFNAERPRQEMAMRLFLDHNEAFEYAWTRYLYYSSSGKLSLHSVPTDLDIKEEHIEDFRDELKEWFSGQAKGEACEVRCFEDQGETVILISRGSYVRTVAYWDGDRIQFRSYRPASEDILIYDPSDGLLSIKAGLKKDREKYLSSFAACVACDPDVEEAASQSVLFSLGPLQEGDFDFNAMALRSRRSTSLK